jgi:phosphoribosylglycinamide formyltransferase 1
VAISDSESGNARVVVLLSGSGRTLKNLLAHSRNGSCPVEIVRVISTRKSVAGNEIARGAGVPVSVVPRKSFDSTEDFSCRVIEIIDDEAADLVVCAGFLSKLIVPERYMGRIVNIHPSLLPLFGGQGFFGSRVHQAVLDSGMKVSGCTVHFVDNEYDSGPIIAQQCVPVLANDTADTLAKRVFDLECFVYPEAIAKVARGEITLRNGSVHFPLGGQ